MENRVTLVGRLGKDPVIEVKGEHQMLRISVATDDSYKDKSGQWVNNTEWHNLTLWGKQAEYVAKFAFKGAVVMVIGMNKTRKWTDTAGHERYDYHVQPSSVKVLTPKKGEGGQQAPPPGSGPGRPPGEDDLPF